MVDVRTRKKGVPLILRSSIIIITHPSLSIVAILQVTHRVFQNSTRDVLSHRRSSTDASAAAAALQQQKAHSGLSMAAHAHSSHRHSSVPTLENSTAQVRALLEKSDTWAEFDILELERLTSKR